MTAETKGAFPMAAGKIGANAAPATTRTSKPEQTAKPGAGAAPTANGKSEQAGKPGEGKGASPKDRANLSEEAREGDKPGVGREGEKPGEGKDKGLKGIRKEVEELKKQLSEMDKPGEKSGGGAEKGAGESGGGCQKGATPAPQAGASQEPGQGQGQPQDINAQLLSEAAQVLMQGQQGQPGAPQAAGCPKKAGKTEGGDARANLARKYLQAVANPQTGQQIKPETHLLVQAALGIGGGQPAGGPQGANPFQAGPAQKVPGLGAGVNPIALAIAS
jgi:hypothetical protein